MMRVHSRGLDEVRWPGETRGIGSSTTLPRSAEISLGFTGLLSAGDLSREKYESISCCSSGCKWQIRTSVQLGNEITEYFIESRS